MKLIGIFDFVAKALRALVLKISTLDGSPGLQKEDFDALLMKMKVTEQKAKEDGWKPVVGDGIRKSVSQLKAEHVSDWLAETFPGISQFWRIAIVVLGHFAAKWLKLVQSIALAGLVAVMAGSQIACTVASGTTDSDGNSSFQYASVGGNAKKVGPKGLQGVDNGAALRDVADKAGSAYKWGKFFGFLGNAAGQAGSVLRGDQATDRAGIAAQKDVTLGAQAAKVRQSEIAAESAAAAAAAQ